MKIARRVLKGRHTELNSDVDPTNVFEHVQQMY